MAILEDALSGARIGIALSGSNEITTSFPTGPEGTTLIEDIVQRKVSVVQIYIVDGNGLK